VSKCATTLWKYPFLGTKPVHRFAYSTFLVGSVPGTPLQVPVFMCPPHCRIERAESQLAAVQEQYGLSDIYLYRSGTGFSAICLRTFPLRRLEKIIRASGSMNYGTLVKYRQLFFRVGEVRDEKWQLLAGQPGFVKIIPAPEENNARFISRSHYHFMKDVIPMLRTTQECTGKGPSSLPTRSMKSRYR